MIGGESRTVADDDGVDDEVQDGVLVLGRVVLQEGRGVVVTDGGVIGPLSQDRRGGGGQREEGLLGHHLG